MRAVAKHLVSVALAAVVVSTLAGCNSVRPWQRSTLARRCMQPDTRPEETGARQHMLGARETSQGTSGKTGGGCGCN